MSPVHKYKKIENRVKDSVSKSIRLFFASVFSLLKLFIRKGKQRFTVMFIPHSEKKIFNFHISVFALAFLMFLVIIMLFAFLGFSTFYTQDNHKLTRVSNDLESEETLNNQFKDTINDLEPEFKDYKAAMEALLTIVGTESAQGRGGETVNINQIDLDDIELSKLKEMEAFFNNYKNQLDEIKKLLEAEKRLFIDIPTLWPVQGGKGNITAIFGVEEDPFTKAFRLHQGVDIAWSYNTPILATANGKVVDVSYSSTGLGIAVKIEHKYGFYTRYGHLNTHIVNKGDKLVRGQIIGYMGSTGKSTGPHVHYEVWIGTKVVDPMNYLDIISPLIEN